ncbi:MAG: hypothetical protein IPN76_14260 [Saprospiraceae bacterium]|nr:hypothetical protein [Saprospiraceae bacterium]
MKLKNKPKITAWLEQGEIGLVLTELKKQLNALSPLPTDWLKTATSLSAQLEKLKADKLKNILSYQEETLAMNKLLDNVQEFVHLIQAEPGWRRQQPTTTAKQCQHQVVAGNPPYFSIWRLVAVPAARAHRGQNQDMQLQRCKFELLPKGCNGVYPGPNPARLGRDCGL